MVSQSRSVHVGDGRRFMVTILPAVVCLVYIKAAQKEQCRGTTEPKKQDLPAMLAGLLVNSDSIQYP